MNLNTKTLLLIPIIAYIVLLIFYWFVVGMAGAREISLDNNDWGAFGSFVGGILSPLFSFISIIILYLSINRNDKNHEKQLSAIQENNRKDHIVRLIDICNQKLDEPLSRQFSRLKIYKSGIEYLPVYEGEQAKIPFPNQGSVRDVIADFYLSKESGKRHSVAYIEIVMSISTNTICCYTKVLESINKIENDDELNDLVDLFEAITEFHSTIALFELCISSLYYQNDCSVLAQLALLNERTEFRKSLVDRYNKALKLKQRGLP